MSKTVFLLCLLFGVGLVPFYSQSQVHFVNGKYMTEWLILGPIPGINLEEDYLAEVNGESQIEPKEGDTFLTREGKEVIWTRYQSQQDLVDFLSILPQRENSTAYAFAYIESPTNDDDVQFFIGKDDGAAVWIQGTQVYLNPENSPHYYDHKNFNSPLKKGTNRCLVKIFQGFGEWSFSLRCLPSSRAEVRGQVLDMIGNPVPSAWVRVEQNEQTVVERQADVTGQYQVSIYPARGQYDLTAWNQEKGNWLLSHNIRNGDRKRYNFRLGPAVSIQGSVLMLDNQSPHVGLVVQALKPSQNHPKSGLDNTSQIVSNTLTDDRGQYQFLNLRPGKYHIRCHIPDRLVYFPDKQPAQRLTVKAGHSNRDVNFYLPAFKKGTWRTYTTHDGLPGNQIFHILKDVEGNLWFSTNNGASKYDGTQFVNYTRENGLIDNTVLKIYQTDDGAIWFASPTGLSKMVDDRFTHLTSAEGLLDAQINDFYVDNDGVFWLGSGTNYQPYGGVTRYDGKTIKHYKSENGLISNSVTAIFQDQNKIMWFGTTAGLSRFDGESFISFTTSDGLPSNYINNSSINQDRDGLLWIGTRDHFGSLGGLCKFDGTTFSSFSTVHGLQTNNLGMTYFKNEDQVWLTGSGGGVLLYDRTALVHITDKDGLADNTVNCILIQDGSVWFATANGVSRYDTTGLTNFTTKDGLADNMINEIAEKSDGMLYIGTGNWQDSTDSGLSIYDGQKFTNVTSQNGLPGNDVWHVYPTQDGQVWLGQPQSGLVLVDGKKVVQYTEMDGLPHIFVSGIQPDNQSKKLWIATLGGLSHFDSSSRTFFNYTHQKNGLWSDFIWCIYQDVNDSLWLGLGSPNSNGLGALSHFDPKNQSFTNYTNVDGLPKARWFNSISRGPKGNLWIGTNNGLSLYDGANFKNFTVSDGLVSNSVNDLLFDSDGLLWIGTGGAGVSVYDGNCWSSFDNRDGLVSDRVRCIHQDNLGYLWFGTAKGLTRYLKRIKKPPIRITSVQTDQDYTDLQNIPPLSFGERVTFKFDTNDFRTLPAKRQYRYRIRELNSAWSKPVRTTTFDHRFESKGQYTFEVQYIDRDLNYSEPASVELTINPPLFYQTMGFLIGVGVIFGIGIVSGTVQTLKMMEQRRRIREYQQLAVEELEEAQGIQMSLMPQSDPDIPGFDITGICVTASEVGGDFFDYIKINQNELGLAVADVSGKQMQGAMNAVMTNGILQLAAQELETDGPSEIMAKMNTILTRRMKNDTNVTMIFGILHSEQKTFNFCNAAHHAHPILCRNGQVETITSSGFPLGMKPDITYPLYQVQLQSGDAIILMSDGIIESIDENGIMYAETNKMEKLLQEVTTDTPASEIRDRLVNDAIQHGADEDLRDDDITVIVIRMV